MTNTLTPTQQRAADMAARPFARYRPAGWRNMLPLPVDMPQFRDAPPAHRTQLASVDLINPTERTGYTRGVRYTAPGTGIGGPRVECHRAKGQRGKV